MSVLLRFFIVAAFAFGTTSASFSQQRTRGISWPYHPNRPGVEAYMQGGAFVANTGSVTAMLFNPAGLSQMPGRLTAAVETGWASSTEYIRFFNIDITSGFRPVQFAGVAVQPWRKLSLGIFYARPTDYNLDFGRIELVDETTPDGTGQVYEPEMAREQTSLGMSLATSFGEQLYFGGSVEWRRSSIQDELSSINSEGDADAVRFSVGAILQARQWHVGISVQTKYEASGYLKFKSGPAFLRVDPSRGNNGFLRLSPVKFSNEDPATIRLGLATPYAFGRLRFNADAEYKDFNNDEPIERWQFYGGGTFKLVSNVHLGFGAFTFRKDYSAYIEGPKSETFWTIGASVEISQLRFSGSFMDGDLLSKDFVGQQFINFAISFVIP